MPPGHPLQNNVYVGHPLVPVEYFPMAQFHRKLFETKLCEAITLLRALGAVKIKTEWVSGWEKDFASNLSVGMPGVAASGSVGHRQKSTSSILFSMSLEDNDVVPSIPDDLVWFGHEPTWQEIANARLQNGLKRFSLNLTYRDDFGITAEIAAAANEAKAGIGGRFEEYESTVWKLTGSFRSLK